MQSINLSRTPLLGSCLLAAVFGFGSVTGVSQRAAQRSAQVPVVIWSGGDTSPCDSLGEVAHLDPKGDNFLSVQSGPGGRPYTEVDRLHAHAAVHVCGERGNWWSVVYGETGETDCHIARPQVKQYLYKGPCRSGWVAKRYIEIIAG